MRYLRQHVLNRRSPSDSRVKIDMTDSIVMDTSNNMLMPRGTTAERPVSPVNGMMRYNTTTTQVEVYQGGTGTSGGTWRSLRFKESTAITQQTLGPGDDILRHFGPLNPAPPTTTESGSTFGAQNLLVYIDTVPQIPNTNFVLIQNPCVAIGTILSFDSGTKRITSSNTSVINFSTLSFHADQEITITGSASNNGTYTIVSVTSSYIEVAEALVTESEGASVTVTAGYASGWYIKFNESVPSFDPIGGQPLYITVIHGFDK